ncbi:PREDICTED: C-type lectin domain family 2 member B [Condylura cristata]|uniref:C-type lectin domain family 2 member B n=1 Tax=Condylura cristata TaxID=143302 RepID=UPI0003346A95|nr:PREDICTED: C-type lectin domain family 2 member B [Condylura cristata]
MSEFLHTPLKMANKEAASRGDVEVGRSARKEMPATEYILHVACPEEWIGFGSKCFYFSDDIGNWTSSQLFCASENASLVNIETLKEMNFLKRYKGPYDHWIGLHRESPNHSWMRTDNTEYNKLFNIRGDGECAYLNDNGVSSGRVYTERKWICSKPNTSKQLHWTSAKLL